MASQRTLLGHRWVLCAHVTTMLVGSLISGTLVEKARHPAPDLDGPRTAVFFKICCDSQATPGSNESSTVVALLNFYKMKLLIFVKMTPGGILGGRLTAVTHRCVFRSTKYFKVQTPSVSPD